MKNTFHIKLLILRERLELEELKLRAFYLPAFLLILIITLGVNSYKIYQYCDMWSAMPQAGGNAFCFCENNRMNQAIRQPANTWSNLGYLIVGLFVFTIAVYDYKNKERESSQNFLAKYPLFSVMYGLSCIYLFAGSFMYHASLTAYYQKLDQTGLYSVMIMMLILNLYKINPYVYHRGCWRNTHAIAKLAAVLINIAFFKWLWKIEINLLVPLLVILIGFTARRYIRKVGTGIYFVNYLYAAFAILFVATSIWVLDRQGLACQPQSAIQGHAAWHILTAASIFFIYLYYRSGTLQPAPLKE